MGNVIGPGATSKSCGSGAGMSKGPGGPANSNSSTTTSRGYDNGRTQGMRSSYKEGGNANNSKA
jgi:hypothetical protein